MGQKVNPHGLRVGVISAWDTQWYADKKNFSAFIKEDNDIRTFLKKKYYDAAISKITIIRAATCQKRNSRTGSRKHRQIRKTLFSQYYLIIYFDK